MRRAFSFSRGASDNKAGLDTRAPQPRTSLASMPNAATPRTLALVLGNFDAEGTVELTVRRGQVLVVIQGGGAPIGWSWACSPSGAGLVPTGYLRMLPVPDAHSQSGGKASRYDSPTGARAAAARLATVPAEGAASASPGAAPSGLATSPRPPPLPSPSGDRGMELKDVPYAAASPSGTALPALPHMNTASSMGEASLAAADPQPLAPLQSGTCSPLDSPGGTDLSGAESAGELELDITEVHVSTTQSKQPGSSPVRLRATILDVTANGDGDGNAVPAPPSHATVPSCCSQLATVTAQHSDAPMPTPATRWDSGLETQVRFSVEF